MTKVNVHLKFLPLKAQFCKYFIKVNYIQYIVLIYINMC